MSLADWFLKEFQLTRRDIMFSFRWDGQRFYVPAFNPLWWIMFLLYTFGLFIVAWLIVAGILLIA